MLLDSKEFGGIVDCLIGKPFERSLAVNSIKLRFGTDQGPKGTHYIWIDPPWEFHCSEGLVTSHSDYTEDGFDEWCNLLNPINEGVLISWAEVDRVVTFKFKNGYSLVLPFYPEERDSDDWYSNWYASDRTT